MRKALIRLLETRGIADQAVLKAIETVPRHLFLDTTFLEIAYKDQAFQIGAGQTISQPYTVAYQTQLLNIQKGDKILEIGTGSGYQTCILLELGAKVYTIERQKLLFDKAKELFPKLNYSPKCFYGDGYKGLPAFAPFDKIIVTAGAPHIPEDLISQLKTGGLMVIPVGKTEQVMTTVLKTNATSHEIIELEKFRFVPLLGSKA
jgi:protein-L-isoaspartate(D-aspartate) O-methyltransferase